MISPGCGMTEIILKGTAWGGTPPYLIQVVFYESALIYAVFEKEFGDDPIDCANLVDEDIPFVSDGTQCDFSGATCLVTAL
jgi:hypothetical protein